MTNDPIEQNLPWLTPWFTTPNRNLLDLTANEDRVLREISAGWDSMPKIALFDSLGERIGNEIVSRVIDKVVAGHIRAEWAELGAGQPERGIDNLIRLVWDPLPAAGFDLRVERRPEGTQIHCTHCPHADLGRQINGSYWLYHLVCSGDPHMTAGFNPRIGFKRTQTLMQGHACCDHFYFLLD